MAAIILIVVGYHFAQQKTVPKPGELTVTEISSPSDAIPSVEGISAYMLMNVSDTGSLHSALSVLPDLVDKMGKIPRPDGIPDEDACKTAETIVFSAKVRDLVGASDAIALYVTSADVLGLYVSMFVDDKKFDPLIKSGDRQLARTEEWTERKGDGDAWILRSDASSDDVLYVTRRHFGETSVVNFAREEKAIEAMAEAAADPSKRLQMENLPGEPNFIRIKLDEPAEINGLKLSETELSWSRSDEQVSIRWSSDMFDGVSDRIVSGDFTPNPPPIMGNGELALLASVDPMFVIYSILPDEDDPVKAFSERFVRGIPAQFAGDLEAILRQCRVSAAVVTSGDVVCTAYVTIDTAAEETLDKLYGIASLFLGGGKELEGWDSALNVPTGTQLNAIAARRGGTVLFGAGDFEEYRHSAEISGDLEVITSVSNIFGVKALPSRLKLNEGVIAGMLQSNIEAYLERIPCIMEFCDTLDFDRVDHVTVTQAVNVVVKIDIYMRK